MSEQIITLDQAAIQKAVVDAVAKKQMRGSKPKEGKPALTIPLLQEWLADQNITVKKNSITHRLEVEGLDAVYDAETLESSLHVIVHDMIKAEYSCTSGLVADLLVVVGGLARYNPIIELLSNAGPWDGHDYIEDVYNILRLPQDDMFSKILVRKWFLQSYSLLYNDEHRPYGGDGALVLLGPQGVGKTMFVSKVGGLRPDFVRLGGYLDFKDKDSLIRCTSTWICELGELETTLRTDTERLKAFLTAERDSYRVPYGRTDSNLIRRTSFIATANSDKLLVDPSGSRRFWTVPITSVDLDALDKLNVIQLWKQVEQDYITYGAQGFRLTPIEQKILAARNADHEKPLRAQSEVEDILSDAREHPDKWTWKLQTVTTFKETFAALHPYSVEAIGKALDKLNVPVSDTTRVDGKKGRYRELPTWKSSGQTWNT